MQLGQMTGRQHLTIKLASFLTRHLLSKKLEAEFLICFANVVKKLELRRNFNREELHRLRIISFFLANRDLLKRCQK